LLVVAFSYLSIYFFTLSLTVSIVSGIAKNHSLFKLYTSKMNCHVKDKSGSGIGDSDTEPQDTEQTAVHPTSASPHGHGSPYQVAAGSTYTLGSNSLDQTPTKENAQSLFPQTFCIYVGK
jgi:hypothetical protein